MGIRRVNRAINKRQLVLRKRGSVAGDGIELADRRIFSP
jgi:hypothetical protein